MKTAFIFFLLGLIAGAFLMHSYDQREPSSATVTGSMHDDWSAKIVQWHLTPDDIRADLARTGQVVRANAQVAGEKIADARVVAVIKSKYILDKDLSARDIHVEAKDGYVTLTGSVPSDDLIGKAVVLALDTAGVDNVTARLTVQPRM